MFQSPPPTPAPLGIVQPQPKPSPSVTPAPTPAPTATPGVTTPTPKPSPPPKKPTPPPLPALDTEEELDKEPTGNSVNEVRDNATADEERARLLGDLPCLEATQSCISQLQSRAIASNKQVARIDETVEQIQTKIDDAKKNGKRAVAFESLKPIVQFYLKDEIIAATVAGQQPTRRRPLSRIFDIIRNPLSAINDILGVVGVPIAERMFGGSAESQTRAIAIGDLESKLAGIRSNRQDLVERIREKVAEQVLVYDDLQRDSELKAALAVREQTRFRLSEITYRFGQGTTDGYLTQMNQLDDKKAASVAARGRVRSQVARIKNMVLGNDEDEG